MTRRWSGLRGTDVGGVEVLDWMRIFSAPTSAVFTTLVQIAPQGEKMHEARTYFVPLHLALEQAKNGWLPVRCADGILQLREAEYSKEYNNFVLHGLSESLAIDTVKGSLTFKPLETIPGGLKAENVSTLGKGDTTNIVVKVETRRTRAFVLKTYKNVSEINPEPEMLATLTEAGFRNTPRMVGQIAYVGLEKPIILAVLQEFVEGSGDGRYPFAEAMRHELEGESVMRSPPFDPLSLAWRLGEIIASMHHALAQSKVKDFGISKITSRDVKEWGTRVEELLENFLEEAGQKGQEVSTLVPELVAVIASRRRRILECLAPMRRMLEMMKIRTHQDLHLAQLLTTQDDGVDFLIIDFEGDPQRRGESRREKECPLRDLGTMARSFSYLRYGVLKELLEEAGEADGLRTAVSYDLTPPLDLMMGISRISSLDGLIAASKEWEAKVRRAMIEGYLAAVERSGGEFLSKRGKVEFEGVDSIVRLWEIEKALLEARYELHHRPQNLIIPLAGLLMLCS